MSWHVNKAVLLILSGLLTVISLNDLQSSQAQSKVTVIQKETDQCRRFTLQIDKLLFHHQHHQALELAEYIISQDRNCARAYMQKGSILVDLDKPEEAIPALRSGFKLMPNFQEQWAFSALAQALFEVHQEKQAFEVLDKGLIYANDKYLIYDIRARMHAEMNHFDRSIKDFTTAIDTCPDKRQCDYRSRALTYVRMHQYQKSVSDFDQAIKSDPKNAFLYSSRSDAYKAMGKTQEAKKDADVAKRLTNSQNFEN